MAVVARNKAFEVRVIRKKILRKIGILSGEYTFTVYDEKEARNLHDKICTELDAGIIPAAIRAKANLTHHQKRSIGELYREMARNHTIHWTKDTEKILGQIDTQIGYKTIAEFDENQLIDWIGTMKARKNAPSTIRNKVNTLKRLFTYLKQEELGIARGIFERLPKHYSQYPGFMDKKDKSVKRNIIRSRRLEEGEEQKLVKSINEYRLDPRMRLMRDQYKPSLLFMLNLAIATGMRLQELFLLEHHMVDMTKRGQFCLSEDITKYNKARNIPMTLAIKPLVKTYMKEYGANKPYVLPFMNHYESREACSRGLSNIWERVIGKAKMDNFRFHDLRHEAISRLVENTTMTVAQMMKITGHADGRTFDRYNNLRTNLLADAMY